MDKIIIESVRRLILALAMLLLAASAVAKDFDDSNIAHIGYPEWFVDNPFLDLQEGLETARAEGKAGLMVLYTTEGCSYCNQFIQVSLGDEHIADQVQKNFHSIGLEIFDDAEMTAPNGDSMSVKQFADTAGAGFAPTLLFFDDSGKLVFRVVGYQSPERFVKIMDYVSGEEYHKQAFRDFLHQTSTVDVEPQLATDLITDSLFEQPPYALDRSHFPAKQPLMVIFEQSGCSECEGFHKKVLALDEIRSTLQQFEVVRLNARDSQTSVLTPNGNKMVPATWYEQTEFTHLPALLFFDERGQEVLRTDALVLGQRMQNSLNFVLEQAYKKGWTYQRFARSKGIERAQQNAQ